MPTPAKAPTSDMFVDRRFRGDGGRLMGADGTESVPSTGRSTTYVAGETVS
jgi:hypothetical protein